MNSSSISLAFASRRHALVRAAMRGAMHCGWDAGIGSGDDLIL